MYKKYIFKLLIQNTNTLKKQKIISEKKYTYFLLNITGIVTVISNGSLVCLNIVFQGFLKEFSNWFLLSYASNQISKILIIKS